jgi:hypothetical protein
MLLVDGSLNSLVAAAMLHEGRLLAGEGGGSFAWLLGAAAMQRAAEAICGAFQLQVVAKSDASASSAAEPGSSIVVLAGTTAAARLGCARLIWPVHGARPDARGDLDLDVIAESIDRATLIGRLASLDARSEIEVQIPFVDLTDRQIADLAVDMGVDPAMCWWAAASKSSPESLAERRRWSMALREAGQPIALHS